MYIIRIILPVILVGIATIYIINLVKNKSKKSDKDENYLSEGMSLGLCFGTAVGIALGQDNLGIFVSLRILLGIVVGTIIKK